MNEFFAHLKQRKLVQWALAYIAATFVVLSGVVHSLIGKNLKQKRDADLKALVVIFLFIVQAIGDSSDARR